MSRGDGYLGLPVTHAGVWALAMFASGGADLGLALIALRLLMALLGGFVCLKHRPALWLAPLAPLWDVFAFLLWLTAMRGDSVVWRSGRMRLSPDGRIIEKTP
jgi:ceramide glucosyltransferase